MRMRRTFLLVIAAGLLFMPVTDVFPDAYTEAKAGVEEARVKRNRAWWILLPGIVLFSVGLSSIESDGSLRPATNAFLGSGAGLMAIGGFRVGQQTVRLLGHLDVVQEVEAEEAQRERLRYLEANFSDQERDAILRERIYPGMSRRALVESWGTPEDINTTVSDSGTHEQFVYSWGRYVYLENGIITSWQY